MNSRLPLTLACLFTLVAYCPVVAQTVLFDFESGDGQGWGSFGPVTTDSGAWPFGSDGFGRFHTGDFDMVGWGMVDVSPLNAPLLDLSGFSGISVDAQFHSVVGYPEYSGHTMLDIGLGFGPGAAIEYYAPPVTLTDSFQTFEVSFASMQLGQDADLTLAIIKLRFLNDDLNSGIGQLDYDQIIGLPIVDVDGDYNGDGEVDAADYVVWRKNDGLQEGYDTWRAHFGQTAGSGAGSNSAVPEPASSTLLLLAAGGLFVIPRGRMAAKNRC